MKRLALDGFSSPARLKVLSELGGLWSLLQLLTFLPWEGMGVTCRK